MNVGSAADGAPGEDIVSQARTQVVDGILCTNHKSTYARSAASARLLQSGYGKLLMKAAKMQGIAAIVD